MSWESIVAKCTATFVASTDDHKRALYAVGTHVRVYLAEMKEGKAKPCKLPPSPAVYKKGMAYLAMLQGVPLADAALALVGSGKAVMTMELHEFVCGLLSKDTLLEPWLALVNEVW